jgi:small subunit ribosomal protein S6
MPLYESTFIVRQDISPADVEKLTETFSKIITDLGGKIIKTENWGLRNLAYIVKKNKKGNYVMLSIDSPYAAVKEMERRMKLSEDILRNMTIRVEEIDNEPSPMMNANFSEAEEDVPSPDAIDADVIVTDIKE